MMEEFKIGIPEELENMQLPNPALLDYYKDTQNRVFWLEGDVDTVTLDLAKQIMRCNMEDMFIEPEKRTPIRIFIDTCGGDVQVMWMLVNAIKISKTPVYTIAFCNALSAGAHILAAGHKRLAFPGSTILVHSGSCVFEGDRDKVESAKKYFDNMSKLANEMLIRDTRITQKDLKRKGTSDWYISAEEALRLGIIDGIITDYNEVLA